MEIPYEVTARRDTGLFNSKIGIWLFLASEVMLFGGLFSAYVFLRVGIDPSQGDIPWPIGVQKIWIGFTNTLVLIASSVFVVLSWLALKERNWRKFQGWMAAVIACALIFMVLKTVEYSAKFSHHGIILTDGSVLEGVIKNRTDRIEFEANSVTINLQGSLPAVANQIFKKEVDDHHHVHWHRIGIEEIGIPELEGQKFKRWFYQQRARVNREMAAARRARRNGESPDPVEGTITLTAAQPFIIFANPRSLQGHTENSLSFNDAGTAKGTLKNDVVSIEVHEVDLQMVPFEKQEGALAWELIHDEAAKKHWFEMRDEELAPIAEWYEERDRDVPRRQKQSRVVSVQEVHLGHHSDEEGHGKTADPGDAGSEEGGSHEKDHYVSVARDQIKFMSDHGPRYHPYYAIYFTMTGLHGLHVLGGALVLAYMLIFGKKLFLRNPEHMANRVEVGGLFWHFVDLVWIFLFPIMYLL